MVDQRAALDDVFHALADPTRRAMLASLSDGERAISDLAEPFAMTLAGASKHVKVLEAAGLVRREKRGRSHVCRIEAGPMRDAYAWLERYAAFWTRGLDRLEELLIEEDAARASKKGTSDD